MDKLAVENDDVDGRLSPAAIVRRNVNNVVQPLLTGNWWLVVARL